MISAVREAIRLDRLYDRLRRERSEPISRAVVLLLKGALWLGVPAFALISLDAATGRGPHPVGSSIGVALGWFLTHWAGSRAAELDAFFSLRLPSRPAYRAARWLGWLPWFLYCGALWSVAAWNLVEESARVPTTAFAFSLPLLQGALSATNSAIRARARHPLARAASVSATGAAIPAAIVLFAFLPPLRPVLIAAPPVLCVLLLGWQIRMARTGEVSIPEESFGEESEDEPRVRAFDRRLPECHAGVTGVAGAARAALRARRRVRPGVAAIPDRLRNLWLLLWFDLRGPISAALLLWFGFSDRGWQIFVFYACLGCLTAPARGVLDPSPRLWLWGVQMREIQRRRLHSILWTAALPTLAAGAAMTLLLSPTPERLALLGFLAASFLFRAGAVGLWHLGTPGPQRVVAIVSLFWCGVWLVASPSLASAWTLVGAVAVLGAAGSLALAGASEEALRERLRESSYPSTIE